MQIEQDVQHQSTPTVLAEGVLFNGNFSAKEPMTIHGTVKGNIKSTSDVMISGKTEGTIQCKGTTEMIQQAEIKGDINTSRFIMSEEALFEGNLLVSKPIKKEPIQEPQKAIKTVEAK